MSNNRHVCDRHTLSVGNDSANGIHKFGDSIFVLAVSIVAFLLFYKSIYTLPGNTATWGIYELVVTGLILVLSFCLYSLGRYGNLKCLLPEQAATMGVPAAIAAFVMLVVMTFFQLGKHLMFPSMTIWESHFITNLFIVVGATGTACFVFRKQKVLYGQAMVEIAQRRQTEDILKRHQEKLYSMTMALSFAEEKERRRIGLDLHGRRGPQSGNRIREITKGACDGRP